MHRTSQRSQKTPHSSAVFGAPSERCSWRTAMGVRVASLHHRGGGALAVWLVTRTLGLSPMALIALEDHRVLPNPKNSPRRALQRHAERKPRHASVNCHSHRILRDSDTALTAYGSTRKRCGTARSSISSRLPIKHRQLFWRMLRGEGESRRSGMRNVRRSSEVA